jgi:hypothetical protein
MSEALDIIIYIVLVGGIFLVILGLHHKPRKHRWYEVKSTDIANVERKKKKGK